MVIGFAFKLLNLGQEKRFSHRLSEITHQSGKHIKLNETARVRLRNRGKEMKNEKVFQNANVGT